MTVSVGCPQGAATASLPCGHTTHGASVAPSTGSCAVARTAELAEYVLDDAPFVEFEDHSAAADPVEDGWVSLADMDHSSRAGNNCHAATLAVVTHLVEAVGLDGDQEVVTAELVYGSGVHWAPVIRYVDGSQVVLDFTARQFDPSVAFPLVVELGEWRRLVDGWISRWFGPQVGVLHLG